VRRAGARVARRPPGWPAWTAAILVGLLAACSSDDAQPTPEGVLEPTVRPTSAPSPAAPQGNVALGRPVTASASLVDDPSSAAVDGDPEAVWNSGDDAPQWIEIDLGAAFDLDRLVLTVAQYPEGVTTHQVFGRGEAGSSRLLGEVRGDTSDQQQLEVSPSPAWAAVRYLRIVTTESPSWVAWREIEVYGRPAQAMAAATGQADIVFYNGNVLTMEGGPVQAIAIVGDAILAVGTDSEILALASEATHRVDLQGRTLTPGFIDSHSHRIAQRYKWGFEGADQAFQEALGQGWTGLTELAVDEAEWNELRSLADSGQLPIRVDGYLLFNTFEGDPLPEWYNAYAPGQEVGPHLRAAGLKFFIDFDSGRQLFFDPPGLAEQIRQRRGEGWQLALKAIGAQSHQLALDAIQLAEGGEDVRDARYRIEHALAQTAEQQARMARMGVIASIQPGLVGVVASWPDIQALIVEEGAETVSNWRGLIDAGVLMAGSPFNPDGVNDEYTADSHMSPMGVVYRGVTQVGLAGSRPQPWMLDHALTVEEILPLLTIDAAYAIAQEDSRGSLAPGKLADLVILSANPLAVAVEGLSDIEVLMTMIGGRVEFCLTGAPAVCP
jgi:predicted amidohydrolase YtcJ